MKKILIILLTFGIGQVYWCKELSHFNEGKGRGANNSEFQLNDNEVLNLDTIDLKKFWIQCVEPLILKDEKRIKCIIEFPLGGEWGFMMGLKKNKEEWCQEDFFENYDNLFDVEVLRKLNELSYLDTEHFNSELLVSIGWKENGVESGIIFRYKKYDGKWKLNVIQAVG
ncbi:MAG: hypothetical protein ACPGSD_13415 [Flavobacteriales bacterium]